MESHSQTRFAIKWATIFQSTYARVAIGMVLILIGYLLLYSYFGISSTDRLYEFRRKELQRLTFVGVNMIQPLLDQQRRGEITADQARAIGRDLIGRMKYIYGLGASNLFMGSDSGEMLVPQLGFERAGAASTDAQSAGLVRDLIQTATSPAGEGFVEYQVPPRGSDQPQLRIAYVVGISEWQVFIGTAMYVGDIDAESQVFARSSLLLTALLFVVIFFAVLFVLRPVLSSYRTLLGAFDQIIRNPDATPSVPAEQYPIGSEARQLLSGFRDMLRQIQHSKRQLQESEERFNLAVQGTNDGIWDWQVKTNTTYFSPRWKAMLGYEDHELPNHFEEWSQRVHPDDLERAMATLNDHLAGHTQFYELEHRLQHKDGSYRWILARGASVRDEYGRPSRMAGSHTDITERKHLDEMMKEQEEQNRKMLEQRVEERTRELATLLEIAHSMTSTLELKPLLRLILNQLKMVVDYNGATVFTLQENELTILDYQGPIPQDEVMRLRFPLAKASVNHEVISRGAPLIIDDVRGDSLPAKSFQRSAGDQLLTTYGYIRSWLGVPLTVQERVIGMMSLDHGEPNHYTPRHAQLALAIANQAAIAIENSRLYWQGKELAALEERQRLARELHDSVSQALYGIALGARTARAQLERDPSKVAEPLEYVLQNAEAGLAEMRALIFELRPESLKTDGLAAALSKQADAVRKRHHIDVQTDLCDEPEQVPLEIKEALYRIVQEGMHNIVKHAHATRIDLKLNCDQANVITLEIADDGVGFDSQATFPGHLGLRSMRERVMRLGGAFSVHSEPGKGTRIRARIPFAT